MAFMGVQGRNPFSAAARRFDHSTLLNHFIRTMKTNLILTAVLAAVGLGTGCATLPPGAEPGPHGTMAYDVLVESSPPGARIEANGEPVGEAPVHIKIFGDTDGTFHDFGSYYYVVRAFPLTTNQFPQVRAFRTGRDFSPEDRIPNKIYFDMNQPAPAYPPLEGPTAYPGYYGPPVYYGPPYYYGPGYYGPYGPSVRFYFGPGRPGWYGRPGGYHRRW